MSKIRLKKPLDAAAVKAADDDFYARHPDMIQNGMRLPLDPENRRHASLIKEWRKAYLANGGELEDTDFGRAAVDDVVTRCPLADGKLRVIVSNCRTFEPLPDVTVEIAGPVSATIRTGADGVADFGAVPPGDYAVWAKKSGYQENTAADLVSQGSTTTIEFCLGLAGDDHWVEFRYFVEGAGYPVQDAEPWTLVYPTGSTETGTLQNGIVRRDGVAEGVYELVPQCFTGISWAAPAAHSGDPVTITVAVKGIPDGTDLDIRVEPRYCDGTDAENAKLSGALIRGRATTVWKHVQHAGLPPFGTFVAIATWKRKRAISDPLDIQPYPVGDDRGLQQRLKHLGYYQGPIDGLAGSVTSDATRRFQEDHPPLAVDGIPGPHTREILAALTY